MLDNSLIDACMTMLPNVRTVTITDPRGGQSVDLDARREPTSAAIKELSGIAAGTESVTFFIPADQPGFIHPKEKWTITDSGGDGTKWVVVTDDKTIQERGSAVVCSRANS